MPLIIADRVLESSTTTGTGVFTLAGASLGFRAFASVCAVADTVWYYIEGVNPFGVPTGEYEYGLGTYSGANQITRTTVRGSSNGGSAVNFTAGTKLVGIAPLAPATAATQLEWRNLIAVGEVSALTALASINGGSLAGLRNRVINGGCLVQQRAIATLSAAPTIGSVDRFLMSTTGSGISGTVQQVFTSGFPTTQMGVGCVGSWTAGSPQIEHRIESYNTLDLNSKTVTISGRLYHNLGSTRAFRVQLNRPTSTADVFSAQSVVASSPTFNCANDAVTPFSFTVTLGSTDGLNGLAIQVYDTATSTVSSKIFAISELQIEVGSVATPFEQRPIGLELALCQRYFNYAQLMYYEMTVSTSTRYAGIAFPEMRVTPTIGNRVAIEADSNIGGVSVSNATVRGARVTIPAAVSGPVFLHSYWPLYAEL